MSSAAVVGPGPWPEAECVRELQKLVAIPSVNPNQVKAEDQSTIACEERLVNYLEAELQKLGAETHLEYVQPGRPNLYALFRCPTSDKWLGIDTHGDTVSVENMVGSPFSGQLDSDGRIHGRGSCDTKATFAICLTLLRELKAAGIPLRHNLLVAATIDEETTTIGADAFREWMVAHKILIDELVVAEPTLCRPINGHKGVSRLQVNLRGLAAHSSAPALGKNAVIAAAQLVLAYQKEHERMQEDKEPGPLGHSSMAPTLVSGGTGINIIPPVASVSVDCRVITTQTANGMIERMKSVAEDTLRDSPHVTGMDFSVLSASGAFFQDPSHAFVQRMAAWSGLEPHTVAFGTNASAYDSTLCKACVVMGPGSIEQAHQADEWIAVSELQKMYLIIKTWLFHE
eukprot:m.93004 g.93004  ORF g.93004 m.93004 type:complete len:400 (+) comp15353_c0_seq1:44-1243(+)